MALPKPRQYTGSITKKLQLTKTVFQFFIQNQQPNPLLFTPGQYATFIIDPQTRRQYTFCSAPNPSSFELIVDVSPMGVGSRYFLERKEGDRVEFLAPFGNFTLSENPLKKVFVATGTGIAPFRSMLLNGKEISNCSLYWGLRYEDDVYWDQEFQTLAGQYTGFQYFLVLSKPSQNWQGLTGHITEHVLKNPSFIPTHVGTSAGEGENLQNSEFYLCGNNAMITEMKNRLSAKNVRNERIKIDLFY
ncbi:TPA: hypothetical protein DIS60_04700 [Patescibacteria group bacterium]|nr:hypothetical protein [Patescibacteria group bacterium]